MGIPLCSPLPQVLERHPDGRWKGSIMKGGVESIGYFPGDYVQLISRPPSGGKNKITPRYSKKKSVDTKHKEKRDKSQIEGDK